MNLIDAVRVARTRFASQRLAHIGLIALLLGTGMQGVQAQHSFAIQTNKGTYLTAVNGGGLGGSPANPGTAPIDTSATQAQGWEIFTIVPAGNGRVTIQTANGSFLTANGGGGIRGADNNSSPIDTDRTSVNTWETFTITYIDSTNTRATIQSWDGHYLTANNMGGINEPFTYPLRTNAMSAQAWEMFTLVPVYNSIQFVVGTGGDQARSDAVVFANMTGQYYPFCLKPTDTLTAFQFCFTTNRPAPTWHKSTTQTLIFPLNPPIVSTAVQGNFAQLQIGFSSYQGGCGGLCYETYNNWNMSSLAVTLLTAVAPRAAPDSPLLTPVLTVYDKGQNCFARFTTINSTTANYKTFQLSPASAGPVTANHGYMITLPSGC